MRARYAILLVTMLAACRDKDAASEERVDPSMLTNSSGEVALTDGGSLDYVITSERYRQWDAAQRALARSVAKRFGEILNPRAPSEQSINRAVAYLEGRPAARQAIERTGMTARDFVVMTVALEQQMQLAASRGGPPPVYAPDATMDSGYLPVPAPTAPPAYPQPYPYPQPQPPYPPTYPPPTTTYPAPATPSPTPAPTHADTVRTETLPPRPQPPRDSTPRRDTVSTRRDTIVLPRTDTTASPPDSSASR